MERCLLSLGQDPLLCGDSLKKTATKPVSVTLSRNKQQIALTAATDDLLIAHRNRRSDGALEVGASKHLLPAGLLLKRLLALVVLDFVDGDLELAAMHRKRQTSSVGPCSDILFEVIPRHIADELLEGLLCLISLATLGKVPCVAGLRSAQRLLTEWR